jgi:hypothetical protein
MPSVDFRLYLVTDRHQTAGRPLVSVVGRAVSAGVRAVQLRERDLPIRELLSLSLDLQRELPDMQLFINDRVDLAVGLGCRGVHLRESSLPAPVVRTLLQPFAAVGSVRPFHPGCGGGRTARRGFCGVGSDLRHAFEAGVWGAAWPPGTRTGRARGEHSNFCHRRDDCLAYT